MNAIDQERYPVRLIIKDALIVLAPSILGLIIVLWYFWDDVLSNWILAK